MRDITDKLGIPAMFNPKASKLIYGSGVIFLKAWEKTLGKNSMSGDALWKSLMFAQEFTSKNGNTIQEPDLKEYGEPNSVLYFGHQGAFWDNSRLLKQLEEHKLRPDVTIIPPGTIGKEFMRTEGHYHLSNLPEVYQNAHGKNIFLLFKTKDEKGESEDIEDILAVTAEPGEIVLFPPRYQHISINTGSEGFVMTDLVSVNANSDFKYIKKHNGAPYWVIKGENAKPEYIRNPRYKGNVPKIRIVKPADEIPEFGLKKGKPIFSIVQEGKISLLDFLNDSSDKYDKIYEKAFVEL